MSTLTLSLLQIHRKEFLSAPIGLFETGLEIGDFDAYIENSSACKCSLACRSASPVDESIVRKIRIEIVIAVEIEYLDFDPDSDFDFDKSKAQEGPPDAHSSRRRILPLGCFLDKTDL